MLEAIVLIAIIAAVLIACAATRPDTFRLARTATIKAPPEKIFPLIDNLRSFNSWNPFVKKDPAIRLVYSGADSGEGAAHTWDGTRDVGAGRLEITQSAPFSKVTMKLDMLTPIEAHNVVEFTLEPHGDMTSVTWAMHGRCSFIPKVMSLFCNMDKMVGGEFEKGLSSLKAIAETPGVGATPSPAH